MSNNRYWLCTKLSLHVCPEKAASNLWPSKRRNSRLMEDNWFINAHNSGCPCLGFHYTVTPGPWLGKSDKVRPFLTLLGKKSGENNPRAKDECTHTADPFWQKSESWFPFTLLQTHRKRCECRSFLEQLKVLTKNRFEFNSCTLHCSKNV